MILKRGEVELGAHGCDEILSHLQVELDKLIAAKA
jgi:hypothetical protein